MKFFKIMATISFVAATSSTMAEGSSDRVYREMIRANEKAMQEYALSIGKNLPK